jgi:hypothetical protein
MQPARDLVCALIEFAAGVQFGQHHFDRRLALGRMHVDGDPTAIIQNSDAIVQMQRHLDILAIASQRFVDAVINHLVDEVM